jgi:hypothetical protein
VDLSLVSVDSTTGRAHHDAAGMPLRSVGLASARPSLIWIEDLTRTAV